MKHCDGASQIALRGQRAALLFERPQVGDGCLDVLIRKFGRLHQRLVVFLHAFLDGLEGFFIGEGRLHGSVGVIAGSRASCPSWWRLCHRHRGIWRSCRHKPPCRRRQRRWWCKASANAAGIARSASFFISVNKASRRRHVFFLINSCQTLDVDCCVITFQFAIRPSVTELCGTMKCAAHQAEAVAVCAYCGRALCAACAQLSATRRMVCSSHCAGALTRNDQALEILLQKSRQSARASAVYAYLCGGLSAAGAVGAHFFLPVPFLIYFTAGCSLVFFASGIWYGRIAEKRIEPVKFSRSPPRFFAPVSLSRWRLLLVEAFLADAMRGRSVENPGA